MVSLFRMVWEDCELFVDGETVLVHRILGFRWWLPRGIKSMNLVEPECENRSLKSPIADDFLDRYEYGPTIKFQKFLKDPFRNFRFKTDAVMNTKVFRVQA